MAHRHLTYLWDRLPLSVKQSLSDKGAKLELPETVACLVNDCWDDDDMNMLGAAVGVDVVRDSVVIDRLRCLVQFAESLAVRRGSEYLDERAARMCVLFTHLPSGIRTFLSEMRATPEYPEALANVVANCWDVHQINELVSKIRRHGVVTDGHLVYQLRDVVCAAERFVERLRVRFHARSQEDDRSRGVKRNSTQLVASRTSGNHGIPQAKRPPPRPRPLKIPKCN